MPLFRTARFIKEFVTNPASTGAVAPSSRFLARSIVGALDLEGAKVVVEYGPGTGSFTGELVANLDKDAIFFAVELNEGFAKTFNRRHPYVKLYRDSVTNIRSICDKEGVTGIDCILSGLPWAAFPERLQDEILDAMIEVLNPGGQFVTFAYLQGLVLPAGKRFKAKIDKHFSHVEMTNPVWLNLPPALCYKCIR